MDNKYIPITLLICALIIGGIIFTTSTRPQVTINNPATTSTMQPTTGMENDSTVSPTSVIQQPTAFPGSGDHKGEGVITSAGVEQGGTAKLVVVADQGTFRVTNETKIYDLNGKETNFEYLERGQLVYIEGYPEEGAPIAQIIKVLKTDQVIPTQRVAQ